MTCFSPNDTNLCRVCLVITDQPKFLFEEIDGDDVTLLAAIEFIASLEGIRNDNFTKSVCPDCANNIKISFQTRQLIRKSDSYLHWQKNQKMNDTIKEEYKQPVEDQFDIKVKIEPMIIDAQDESTLLLEITKEEYDTEDTDPLNSAFNDTDLTNGSEGSNKKRKRQPNLWKRNISKRKRQSGEEYVNGKGKIIEKRQVRDVKCVDNDCPHKCGQNFPEHDRLHIFEQFWKLTDEEKSSYYSKYIVRVPAKRRRQKESSMRQHTNKYYFEKNGRDKQVCASFFLKTLDISRKRVGYHFKHLNDDRQQIRSANNRLPVSDQLAVIAHINTYPADELQCCANIGGLKYFEPRMNCTKMHRKYCEQTSKPVKYTMFVNIFKENFMNHRFLKIKQTVCDQCTQ